MRSSKYAPFVVAFLIGISWFLVGELGEREGTSTHYLYYWKIGFPVVLLAFCALGFVYRVGAWKWSLTVVFIQLFGLLIAEGIPDILPFTAMILVLILCCLLIAGYVGSWFSAWANREKHRSKPESPTL